MPIKYISHVPNTVQGQAILNNFSRTHRVLSYKTNNEVFRRVQRGLPLYEVEETENVGDDPNNLLIRGECLSACAYLKDKGIKVDLVYIDPPFASGADYAKKVYIRRNPHIAEKIAKAEEELDIDELRSFEEKMYGDIWNKEDYLNWMYENLVAIKSIMSDSSSIYLHIDWHIGHYVKILMDEIFGEHNFRREIIWDNAALSGLKTKAPNWIKAHDTIFYYSMSEEKIFNKQTQAHRKEYLDRFDKIDENGKKYFDGRGDIIYLEDVIKKGKAIGDVWYDIMSFQQIPTSLENVDYSTQKPKALLERIIKASSNDGMLIADFFGGSGVTAKVANQLNRKFIHVDVGVNSIQTVRDGLFEANAKFKILDIKDGVSLFRNPIQTMNKLKSLIQNLCNEDSLDSFWEGAIHDSSLGLIPVYIPNLLDHSTKVLDIPLINRILNEAIPDLKDLDNTKKIYVYYIDIEDKEALLKFIDENNKFNIKIELKDLKEILDEVIINDIANFEVKENEIEFTSFISDRLIQKINEYNQKRGINRRNIENQNSVNNEENNSEISFLENNSSLDDENVEQPKKFNPIKISDNGLELIEMISLDCSNRQGIWTSDVEIKIDKYGYISKDGKKTKQLWDGKISFEREKKPLRMKIRNIAGDESIFPIS